MVGSRANLTNPDFAIVKTDSAGNVQWDRMYGGAGLDQCNAVQQTADGGYILAGYSNSFAPAGDDDAYAVRINSIGDTLWTRTFRGSFRDRFYHVTLTPTGGFIFTGDALSFAAGPEIYTVHTETVPVHCCGTCVTGQEGELDR